MLTTSIFLFIPVYPQRDRARDLSSSLPGHEKPEPFHLTRLLAPLPQLKPFCGRVECAQIGQERDEILDRPSRIVEDC